MAALPLESRTESIFLRTPTGTGPERDALDAVAQCRHHCKNKDWMIDVDIREFFDTVPWDLMVKAVQANTTHEQRWIVLYVRQVAGRAHRDARRQAGGAGPRYPSGLLMFS